MKSNIKHWNKLFIIVVLFCKITSLRAQSFNDDKTALVNYLKRMYMNSAIEGVKIVDDYNHIYLISILSLESANYTSQSTMYRVAQVKAQRQASLYLNGSEISFENVISTRTTIDSMGNSSSVIQSIEYMRENSMGFSQGLELFTVFEPKSGQMVFIYGREVEN